MIVPFLRRFFAPLTLALRSRPAALVLIRDLGWTPDETFELDAFEILAPLETRLQALLAVIDTYDSDDPNVGGIVEQAILLAGDVQTAIQDLRDLTQDDYSNLVAPLNTGSFWEEFALDLPEYLILTYLKLYMPPVYALVEFGGAIVMEPRPDGRPDRATLNWEALGRLFTEPDQQIRDEYDWGGTLRHDVLIARLHTVLRAFGLPVRRGFMPEAIAADRFTNGSGDGIGILTVPVLDAVRHRMDPSDSSLAGVMTGMLDLMLAPVPDAAQGSTPDGLLLTLRAIGAASLTADLGRGWLLSSTAMVDASGAVGAELQPTGLSLATGSQAGSLSITLSATTPPDAPMILFGAPKKTRLELVGFSASAGASADANGGSLEGSVALDSMQVVLCTGDGDSFIADILDGQEVTVPITFGLDWSTAEGVKINGGGGFEIEFLVDTHLGPAHIQKINVGGEVTTEGAAFFATTAGSLVIGPFGTVVDGLGLQLKLEPTPRGQGGRSGAVTVKLGFKAPNEIGLFLDAPGVGGGGYLAIDPDEGRYAGILDITLFGFKVTAIGLIATRLPSGEEGWSLFLSISIIFPSGIPLVFGFSWTGVGGLIGVNRGIDIEAMGDGVRSGSLDAVLFPEDAIANAPMILSALDSFFPAQRGQYAFGPIFQISWGVNDLLTIQLGLAIQLPTPITISLLGSLILKIGLPEEGTPAPPPGEEPVLRDIVRIRVDVIGTLWPTEGRLWIDASISEGFIVGMNLSGDMSVRLEFGNRPNMIAAMGGFHPQFTPPEGFPSLRRLSFSIFNEPKLRIGVESYIAVSSNAFHFGVAAFFYAKAIGFKAEGRFEFDTIIIFRPFGMTASLGFQVSISAGSQQILQVRLRGTLEGPKPWFVTGYAEFKVLGAKKKFRVEMTLGRAVDNGPRQAAALFETVKTALQNSEAWTSEATDPALAEAVSFAAGDAKVFHPAARVVAMQGIAPLGLRLERFGEDAIADGEDLLTVAGHRLGGQTALADAATEWFAPARYFDMSEEEKLTAPSFEELEAGRIMGAVAPEFAPVDPFPMGHENIIVDPDVEAEWPKSTDEGKDAPWTKHITPAMKGDFVQMAAGLDLRPRATMGFAVADTQMTLVDPDAPDMSDAARPSGSFSHALAAQRSAARSGQRRVVAPDYELDLEEV